MVDFVSRSGNLIAIAAILFLGTAALLGVGHSSTAELLNLEAWLRAATSFLRKL
jgi:hypothetical protein